MDTVTVNVFGTVTDLSDKFGLKWARVRLENNQNSYKQTCGDDGKFMFRQISPGKYQIVSDFVGYYQFKDSIELKSGEIIELKIGLGHDE